MCYPRRHPCLITDEHDMLFPCNQWIFIVYTTQSNTLQPQIKSWDYSIPNLQNELNTTRKDLTLFSCESTFVLPSEEKFSKWKKKPKNPVKYVTSCWWDKVPVLSRLYLWLLFSIYGHGSEIGWFKLTYWNIWQKAV